MIVMLLVFVIGSAALLAVVWPRLNRLTAEIEADAQPDPAPATPLVDVAAR